MRAETAGRLALALLCLGGGACDLFRDGAGEGNEATELWLTCVECEGPEVDSLRAAAARDAGVVKELREVLIHGPAVARHKELVAQFEANYARLQARAARTTPPDVLPLTAQQYVEHYLASAVLVYRGRAALGLGVVGGPIARQALDSASKGPVDTLPPAVGKYVRYALDSLLTQ